VDPREIAADAWRAARRRSTAFAEDWLRSPDRIAFADAFDSAASASLAVARDRAVALLSDRDLARRLFSAMTCALAADPLFDPPLRTTRENGHIGAILFDVPAARMSAALVSAGGLAAHPVAGAIVPGHVTVTRYVHARGARLRRWRIADDADRLVELPPLTPADGQIVVHDGRREAQSLVSANGDVAMLSILLRAGAVPVVREFSGDTGAPLRTASSDDAAARTSMLLTLLRVGGRTDADAAFAAATHDPAPHARWAAMREWLALDTAAALPRLRALAATERDAGVRTAAAATLDLIAGRGAACPG